ncbi:MAG TPA: OmpA family protein [Paracoccaceae bacterium]|nr:OmpA family protein [Paracoccaceae bacterium]
MTPHPFSALAAFWAALLALGSPAQAITFDFPGPATVTAETRQVLASYRLPTGPWAQGGLPARLAEGAVEARAWRIDAPGLTTLQILTPLRDQLAAAGFETIFECETRACGGFDFRYATETLPEPDMHVDLGDFRFLSAERQGAAGAEVLALMVSRSSNSGFVQVTRVVPGGVAAPPLMAAAPDAPPRLTLPQGAGAAVAVMAEPPAAIGTDIGAQLLSGGAVVLEDLVFPSGTAALATGDYPSLVALAEWLRANPDKQVALVGHTDAAGGLETNVVLSRRRAESVRAKLMALDVPPAQIEAQGVGYLSPRDTNLTEEGRTRNRRVEVILTSTR